jgi:hypothetical protein
MLLGNIQYCDTMRLFAQEYIILVEHLQAIREAPRHEHHQELGLPASPHKTQESLAASCLVVVDSHHFIVHIQLW